MKRNQLKKKKSKKSPLINTQERLNHFQTKFPYKFRQVFESFQKGQQEISDGFVQKAKESFEKALMIYPDYIPALNQLAAVYGLLKDNAEAIKIVKKVLTLDDKNVFALIQGAIFLFRQEQVKEAEFYAKKALASFHEREGYDAYHDYDMLQKLVEMLSVLKLDVDVKNLYEKRKNQLSPMSYYLVAISFSNEGLYHEAREALQKIHQDTPIKENAAILDKCLKISLEEKLEVPKLAIDDETCLKQMMSIIEKFGNEKNLAQKAKINNNDNVTKEGQALISTGMGITELLSRYTKDKLVSLVKFYKIRGYSKLNKNNLIKLIEEEIYSKRLWEASLDITERKIYDTLVEKGLIFTEKQLMEFFREDTENFIEEVVSDTNFEEMKSNFGKLMAKGILFFGVNEEKSWQIQVIN